MKRLVFLDIDGTILPEGKTEISTSIKKAITSLQARGTIPILCTGRNAHCASSIFQQLNINSYITSNGQQITIEGKIISSSYFSNDEYKRVCETILLNTPHIAVEDKMGINVEDTETGRELLKLIIGHGFFGYKALAELPTNEVFQLWAFGTEEQIENVIAQLKGKNELYRWTPHAVEIAPLNAGKGSAISKVLDYFGNDTKTFAFGDGTNDHTMMEIVDISIAMGNASSELKKVCNYVTDNCEEDGVVNGLKYYNLI